MALEPSRGAFAADPDRRLAISTRLDDLKKRRSRVIVKRPPHRKQVCEGSDLPSLYRQAAALSSLPSPHYGFERNMGRDLLPPAGQK
jgi:hypothetical protein